MGELSITAPAKGDPITAAWAQAVTDAANGGQTTPQKPGEARFPGGYVPSLEPTADTEPPPRLPMPFELRLVTTAPSTQGAPPDTHLHVYIPAPTAACPWVSYGPVPCVPAVGFVGWVDLGIVPTDDVPRYACVYVSGRQDENFLFSVCMQTSYRVPPAGGVFGAPLVPIGEVRLPSSIPTVETPLSSDDGEYGLLQYAYGRVDIPGGPGRPLEVRGVWEASGNSEVLHAYVCVTNAKDGFNINGRTVALQDSGGNAMTGDWFDLGAMGSFAALWLLFTVDTSTETVESVTNYGASNIRTYGRLVAGGVGVNRPNPLLGDPRENPPVLVWYNTKGGFTQTVGCGVQCIVGGETVSIECPDSRVFDPADNKAFRSIGWRGKGATELYGFSTASGTAMTDTIADNAAMVARVPNGSKYDIKYMKLEDVACVSGTGIRWNGQNWIPQYVSYKDGNDNIQTMTVLVKQ